jgi:catechol 2,3-dioxygenase-like lactoylglutathione lyase family enzyme
MRNRNLLRNNFNGLQHLGIPVSNLEQSVSFYTRLGFNLVLSTQVPDPAGTTHVAMMKRDNVIIELYQKNGEEIEALPFRSDGPIDHIAFDVIDIDKAFEELKTAGFETIEDEPVFLDFWEKGCKYFTIRGSNGEKLEFNQIL